MIFPHEVADFMYILQKIKMIFEIHWLATKNYSTWYYVVNPTKNIEEKVLSRASKSTIIKWQLFSTLRFCHLQRLKSITIFKASPNVTEKSARWSYKCIYLSTWVNDECLKVFQ